jgi:hypothetical protein
VIHRTDRIQTLPYLPDPMAIGFALTVQPTGSALAGGTTVASVPFNGTWPEQGPIPLVLRPGPIGPPGVAPAANGLTVTLAPGTMLTLAYSATLDATKLGQLSHWNDVVARFGAGGVPQSVVNLATNGQMRVLTPARTLTFVHAVLRPKDAPDLAPSVSPFQERSAGATYVTLAGTVLLNGQDTARVDIEALWSEVEPRRRHPRRLDIDPPHRSRSVFERGVQRHVPLVSDGGGAEPGPENRIRRHQMQITRAQPGGHDAVLRVFSRRAHASPGEPDGVAAPSRLIVEEAELRGADAEVSDGTVVLHQGDFAAPYKARVVYADTFAILSDGTVQP